MTTWFRSVRDYFAGAYQELKKVAWPTRREVISHTGVIIGLVAASIIIFGLVDFGLLELLRTVILNRE